MHSQYYPLLKSFAIKCFHSFQIKYEVIKSEMLNFEILQYTIQYGKIININFIIN